MHHGAVHLLLHHVALHLYREMIFPELEEDESAPTSLDEVSLKDERVFQDLEGESLQSCEHFVGH
jgi:hypothetical protein